MCERLPRYITTDDGYFLLLFTARGWDRDTYGTANAKLGSTTDARIARLKNRYHDAVSAPTLMFYREADSGVRNISNYARPCENGTSGLGYS